MKKTAVIFLIIFIVLFSVSCSDENFGRRVIKNQYVFRGENDLWFAEYRVNGEGRFTEKDGRIGYDSWTEKMLLVVYKNEISELSDVTSLEISYQAGPGGGSKKMNSLEGGPTKKVFTLHSGSNGSVISKDDTITVTIILDGKSQSFELKNKTSAMDNLHFLLHGKSFYLL